MTEAEELGRRFPIELVPYDPAWPDAYHAEANILRVELDPEIVVRIQHYGSTAVPGLSAKNVIDILIEVTSLDRAERELAPVLETLGYAWNWYKGHLVFFKGYYPDLSPRYHIHMATGDHRLMDDLLFRDYLRDHPETAREYEELKRRLAIQYHYDREAYTDAKGDFVTRTIEMAKVERSMR